MQNDKVLIFYHLWTIITVYIFYNLLSVNYLTQGVYANLVNMQTFETKEKSDEGNEREPEVDKKVEAKKSVRISTKEESKKEEDVTEEEEIPEAPMSSIYKLNQPEICYNIFGILFSFAIGAIQPLFGILFAEILGAFGYYACAYDDSIAGQGSID